MFQSNLILTTNGQLATAQLRSTLARLDFDPPCLIASQDQHMWHIKNKIDSGHVTHPFWWDKTRFTRSILSGKGKWKQMVQRHYFQSSANQFEKKTFELQNFELLTIFSLLF